MLSARFRDDSADQPAAG